MRWLLTGFYNAIMSSILVFLLRLGFFRKNPSLAILVFSYDRPSQLYSLLKSIDNYVTGYNLEVVVLYRVSDDRFLKGYNLIDTDDFAFNLSFIRERSFKSSLTSTLNALKGQRILTLVDDQVFYRAQNLSLEVLPEGDLVTFRFGKNTDYSYTLDRYIDLPELSEVGGYISWRVGRVFNDFNYPLSLDATIYPGWFLYLESLLLHYTAPNSFEGAMNRCRLFCSLIGISISSPIKQSAVNIVLNKVQTENDNRSLADYPAENLLESWFEGGYFSLDRSQIEEIRSPHIDYGFESFRREIK